MTRIRILLVVLFAMAVSAGSAWAQDRLVTGLSTENIALNATFDGSEIFVFGAVRPDDSTDAEAGPIDILITIKGPETNVTVRRKERRFGIWTNTDQITVRRVPSFYAIAATRPLDGLLTETELLRHGIGMREAVRHIGSHPELRDTADFAEAVVRIRQENGLYARMDRAVNLAEGILFQSHFELPANLVEGTYRAEFFLVRDKIVTSSTETAITVEKTGIERWLYNLSQDKPLSYGILSLVVALSAGWFAAAAFRLIKR